MTPPLVWALGADFGRLPAVLRAVHSARCVQTYRGRAEITAAPSRLGRLIARIAGFPLGAGQVEFHFSIAPGPESDSEVWQRQFGAQRTVSTLRAGSRGCLYEAFGPFRLTLQPRVMGDGFSMTIKGMRAFGLPVPPFFLPRSQVREWAISSDEVGFDIAATLPFFGHLIRYQGQFTASPQSCPPES